MKFQNRFDSSKGSYCTKKKKQYGGINRSHDLFFQLKFINQFILEID
jgi:hypothetical protein